jgi:Tol biopolymer transport system component
MGERTLRVVLRQAGLALLVTGAALAGLSCGGDITTPPTTGSLVITTSTSGPEPDADGYAVKIDEGAETAIATSGTLRRDNIESGNHSVRLTGMAANCTVAGENPRSVSVPARETVTVTFDLTCSAATGSLEITTTTTGSSLDVDGYMLSLDGGASQPIAIHATLTLGSLAVGSHSVVLSGIVRNCHLDGDNPRTVAVVPGATTVTFSLRCLGSDALIAFSSGGDIVVVHPDGTGRMKLTPNGSHAFGPIWSPEGRKILFYDTPAEIRDISLYVMNADGSGRLKLADGPIAQGGYRWSPDGRMIAFVTFDLNDPIMELWVMQADGSGKVMLSGDASAFCWSPDGERLAYVSLESSLLHIINLDGSGDVQLTNLRVDKSPAWSPDGTRIAFRGSDGNIHLISPDGTGEVDITHGAGNDAEPTWSPDGSKILLSTTSLSPPFFDESNIAVMNRDGSSRVVLTRHLWDAGPGWSPDGKKIVFVRETRVGFGDHAIHVMNADGSNQTNVSNTGEAFAPDWNGQGP